MKKTKIVATLGPACYSKEVLTQMIQEGVDVCRLNFSHGSHEDHNKMINLIKEINTELNTNTAILADLQGPKIRVGEMENNGVELIDGNEIIISTEPSIGTAEKLYINYQRFPKDVKAGEKILLDDGKLMLEIQSSNKQDTVVAKIIHGGILSSKKGVNLPNTQLSMPCLTEKDLKDLDFILTKDIDWIALSFVRSARDIIELKHLIGQSDSNARIISKIEKPEAIEDIDEIIRVTDALMVARGDLGVEIPMEDVPMVQKELIKKCLKHAKPAIVATQMMESMITNISPTRAEVNDVANAVLDGADAVMLSGETSVGKYPVDVIKAMSKIVSKVESSEVIYHHEHLPENNQHRFITDSICFNAARLALRVNAKAVITLTHSGYTAYKISSQRPKATIFAFTDNKSILNILNLTWGVKAFYYDKKISTDHTIADVKQILKDKGYLVKGDYTINLASIPLFEKGETNMVKLSEVI